MEDYVDTWDHQTICGLNLGDLRLDDGKVTLKVQVNDDGNFQDASSDWKTCRVSPADLHAFMAGLTVIAQGIGNGVDDEINMELGTISGYVPLNFDDKNDDDSFHDDYILWTNDGGYDDPQLEEIQERVQDEKTPASFEAYTKLSSGEYVMAMVIDYFTTLFKRNLPLSFIQGLETFQELSHSCDTSLAEL